MGNTSTQNKETELNSRLNRIEDEENINLKVKKYLSDLIESFNESSDNNIGKTNILLIGKTNVGKSLLCRSLFSKYSEKEETEEGESAEEEIGNIVKFGESSTLEFIRYAEDKRPYVVYDSRGFEIGSYNRDIKIMKKFIEKNSISVVFIMVSVLEKIEKMHLKIYYELTTSKRFKILQESCFFVFTKCDEISERGADLLRRKLTNPNTRGEALKDTWKILIPKSKIFFTSCDVGQKFQRDLGPFQCCEQKRIKPTKQNLYSCRICRKVFACEKCGVDNMVKKKKNENSIIYFCDSCKHEWKGVKCQQNQIEKLKNDLLKLCPRDLMNLLCEIDFHKKEKSRIANKVALTLVVLISSTSFNGAIAVSPIPFLDFPGYFSCEFISIMLLASIWEFPLKNQELWKWFMDYMLKTLTFSGLFMFTGIPKIALSILKVFVIADEIVIPVDVALSVVMTLSIQVVALFVFISLYHVVPKSVFSKLNKEQQKVVLELLTERVKKYITKEIILEAVEHVKKKEEISTDFFLKPMSLEDFGDEMIQRGFTCSLSLDVLKDPVILVETGQIYEREMIEEWLENNDTCPNTQTKLKSKKINPHTQLKELIDFWRNEKTVDFLSKEQKKKKVPEEEEEEEGLIEIKENEIEIFEEKEKKNLDIDEMGKISQDEKINDYTGVELSNEDDITDSLDIQLEEKKETYISINFDKYNNPCCKEVEIVVQDSKTK